MLLGDLEITGWLSESQVRERGRERESGSPRYKHPDSRPHHAKLPQALTPDCGIHSSGLSGVADRKNDKLIYILPGIYYRIQSVHRRYILLAR